MASSKPKYVAIFWYIVYIIKLYSTKIILLLITIEAFDTYFFSHCTLNK